MDEKNNSFQNNGFVDDEDIQNVQLPRKKSMLLNKNAATTGKNEDEEKKSEDKNTLQFVRKRVCNLCREVNYLKLELVMFLYMFSYTVRNVTNTVLMMDKVCLIHLGRPASECMNLKNDSLEDLKTEVEKMANNYHVGHTLLAMVPSAILSLFIGAWSDKYGRKIPIIVALIGIIIDGFGVTVCAHFLKSRVEYMYITASFIGLSGGFIGVLLVLYAYASDISSAGKRTVRYALLEMSFALSMPLGSLAGGWICEFFGYVPVFLTSTCGHILGLFWVVFMLEETKGLDSQDSWSMKFRSFWSTTSLISAFKTTIKKRPNQGREQIWALILGMSISVFAFASTASVGYFYVHRRYNWNNPQYSTVSAVFSVLAVIVMLIVVPLSKKYEVRDEVLGIVGSISLVAQMLCMGLAVNPPLYYLACLLGLLSSLATLAGRSKISKVTPNEDLGKVFAFSTTAESVLPIAATTIISQGFNASLQFFPGLVYVIMGALSVLPVLIFVWISRMPNANCTSDNMEKEAGDIISLSNKSEEKNLSMKT